MDPDIVKYLEDIILSIQDIRTYVSDISASYQYQRDRKTRDAVERRLAVIGEALNKSNKIDNSLSITNKTKIIALRHILVHDYDLINSETIWQIITKHLPLLKIEVEQILKSLEEK
jgi:uncharacterized protein with HEPN domain